jgi:hypothetical protein
MRAFLILCVTASCFAFAPSAEAGLFRRGCHRGGHGFHPLRAVGRIVFPHHRRAWRHEMPFPGGCPTCPH